MACTLVFRIIVILSLFVIFGYSSCVLANPVLSCPSFKEIEKHSRVGRWDSKQNISWNISYGYRKPPLKPGEKVVSMFQAIFDPETNIIKCYYNSNAGENGKNWFIIEGFSTNKIQLVGTAWTNLEGSSSQKKCNAPFQNACPFKLDPTASYTDTDSLDAKATQHAPVNPTISGSPKLPSSLTNIYKSAVGGDSEVQEDVSQA